MAQLRHKHRQGLAQQWCPTVLLAVLVLAVSRPGTAQVTVFPASNGANFTACVQSFLRNGGEVLCSLGPSVNMAGVPYSPPTGPFRPGNLWLNSTAGWQSPAVLDSAMRSGLTPQWTNIQAQLYWQVSPFHKAHHSSHHIGAADGRKVGLQAQCPGPRHSPPAAPSALRLGKRPSCVHLCHLCHLCCAAEHGFDQPLLRVAVLEPGRELFHSELVKHLPARARQVRGNLHNAVCIRWATQTCITRSAGAEALATPAMCQGWFFCDPRSACRTAFTQTRTNVTM